MSSRMSYYGSGSTNQGYSGGGQQQQQQSSNNTFQSGYGDPNSWQQQQQFGEQQQQQQQQSQYGQQQPQQQQPQPQVQPFWNPAAAASMAGIAASAFTGGRGGSSNDQMLDLAGKTAETFLQNSWARMVPGLERAYVSLRPYFAVDNRYVVLKIKRVLVPFLAPHWKRQVRAVQCIF